jgi:putative addiction module killer protein
LGNFGDHKPVGSGVNELRIDLGPGFRIYYGEQAGKIVLLLAGGDKSTQQRDIIKATTWWKQWKASKKS